MEVPLKKQQDRRLMLQEYLKKKHSSTPAQPNSEVVAHSLVTPVSRPQPPPAPHKSAQKYEQISKALFQEKENIHENKRHYIHATPTRTATWDDNEKNLPMEEKLRLWKEKKGGKPTPKSSSKPRPNPASFTSTSSLFDNSRSFPRPALAARTAQPVRAKPAPQSRVRAEDAGNDTGNEGGDEREQRVAQGVQPEINGEEEVYREGCEKEVHKEGGEKEVHEEGGEKEIEGERMEGGETDMEGEDEAPMDMSALLSPGDQESLLKGLGKWQQLFQEFYSHIEEKLRLIQEGALSAESVREWIRGLKPNYTGMTQFYVLWAVFEERLMMFDNAGAVYDLGIQDNAEPQYELLKEYRAFLDRKAQSDINRFNKTVEALSSTLAQSQILQSPPRSATTQPTSTRKLRTPSRLTSLTQGAPDDTALCAPASPYRDTSNAYREPQRVRIEEEEERERRESMGGEYEETSSAMELNESLMDNFQHMGILTPRVYKSTPPRHTTSRHTPPHTPPSIPNEICDFSPVSPDTPPRLQPTTPLRALTTPSRVINMEAILRDSVKKVLTRFTDATPSKPSSYVVLEKVALSKEESEALGADYAVTPVRKYGVRPRSTHRNLLDEVGFAYTPSKGLFKHEEEPEEPLDEVKQEIKQEIKTEIKEEIKEEEYELHHYTTSSDAELADDEKREEVQSDSSSSILKKTPKNRKRSRSALPLMSPALGTFESLEITRKRNNVNLEEAISLIATPHRSSRKSAHTTPANTPRRKKVRMDVEPEEIEDEEVEENANEETISVTNVRRSKRISTATPIKLPPSQKKSTKVIFTPNYHRSSNITDANELAKMIDMTNQDYYVSSD